MNKEVILKQCSNDLLVITDADNRAIIRTNKPRVAKLVYNAHNAGLSEQKVGNTILPAMNCAFTAYIELIASKIVK